jgi:thymidine phosphorylase
MVENPAKLVVASQKFQVKAKKRSYLTQMDTEAIGKILIELGGGRRRASDLIDPSTGIEFHRKLGSRVQVGEPIATIYAPESANAEELHTKLIETITFSGTRKAVAKLVLEQV